MDEILGAARQLGITFIDTARTYGDSEAKIGDHLRRGGSPELTIATKVTPVPPGLELDSSAIHHHILTSLSESRSALGRAPDIVLLRQSDEPIVRNATFWQVANEVIAASVPRIELGISVYDLRWTHEVLAAAAGLITVVEIPYNAFDRRFEALSHDFRDLGCWVVSRSTFLKGLLPLPTAHLPAWAGALAGPKRRLDELAASGGTTVADLVLRWCLRAGFVHTTLVGVDTAAELREDARAMVPRPELDPFLDEVAEIEVDADAVDPRRWAAFGF